MIIKLNKKAKTAHGLLGVSDDTMIVYFRKAKKVQELVREASKFAGHDYHSRADFFKAMLEDSVLKDLKVDTKDPAKLIAYGLFLEKYWNFQCDTQETSTDDMRDAVKKIIKRRVGKIGLEKFEKINDAFMRGELTSTEASKKTAELIGVSGKRVDEMLEDAGLKEKKEKIKVGGEA